MNALTWYEIEVEAPPPYAPPTLLSVYADGWPLETRVHPTEPWTFRVPAAVHVILRIDDGPSLQFVVDGVLPRSAQGAPQVLRITEILYDLDAFLYAEPGAPVDELPGALTVTRASDPVADSSPDDTPEPGDEPDPEPSPRRRRRQRSGDPADSG